MINRSSAATLSTLTAVAVLAACAPRPTLAPAPEAQPAPGQPGGAAAAVAGVEMHAWPEQWDAGPADILAHTTPVLVRIENNGTENVLVRFEHFELRDPAGDDFPAIPPFELDATVREPIAMARYPLRGFRIAPHLRAYYPGLTVFPGTFALNRGFWNRHATIWREVQLPTVEMVQLALPEGVIEPGGVATGFVFFEPVTEQPDRLTLDYRLVTTDGDELGRVRIPFVVQADDF